MSVINNVLKDLETRESRFTPIETGSVEAPLRAPRNWKPLALASTILFLLAAGVWLYLQAPQSWAIPLPLKLAGVSAGPAAAMTPEITDPEVAIVMPQQPTAPDPAESLPAPVAAALSADDAVADTNEANQIIGLQIRESEQEMRLQFFLREKVVAYLRERGENTFAYHLRDIQSQILAPVISDNPWIQRLAIDPGNAGVDIHFETAADILVETRQNLVDGEAVWTISLRKAIAPAPAVTEEASESAPELVEAAPQAIIADESVQAVESAGAEPAVVDETAPVAAEVRLEIKTTNPGARVASQLEYASRLLGTGRYTDAENLLRELLGGVEDYQARRHLLAIYDGQQRLDRFNRLARESAQKYPQDIAFKTEYARSLFRGQAYRAVIELFAGQTELDARQQAMLAASYQRIDEHDNAIRHYRLALRQDAGNAKAWIGLGISQEHNAELEAALDSYQRAGIIGQLNERLQAFVEQRSDSLRRVLN